jgi:hypothetical protein
VDNRRRSVEDLIDCQKGSDGISSFQVGNEEVSLDIIDCEKGSDGISSFQVGNEEVSLDLIDCQGGRGEIPYHQVGKGEEMNSAESSYQQGVLINEDSCGFADHMNEDSCGFADHMNEDDEKLYIPIAIERDQRCVLIIGGIQLFLPYSLAKTNTIVSHEEVVQQESGEDAMGPTDFKSNFLCDAGAVEERHPVETIREEQILMPSPT